MFSESDRPSPPLLLCLVGGNRILIDECSGHGMWFDHGELTGVLKEACANNRGQDLAESLVRLLDEVFVPGSGE